jgi:hypothetical protein
MKEQLTGLGHQFKRDAKALSACKSSLEQAYRDIYKVGGYDAVQLLCDIKDLIDRANSLACSAEEAYNQND